MIQEGVYIFGGYKSAEQLCENKLRYLKVSTVDNKIASGEFINIKAAGQPPCPRYGHCMGYLPHTHALLICGGRNESLANQNKTPLLNDVHLFLLDQKVWLKVKYSVLSDRLSNICNAALCVVSDESFEKVVIFGGLQHAVKDNQIESVLTNKTYLIEVSQRKVKVEGESVKAK